LEIITKVLSPEVISFGRVTVTPAVVEASFSMVVVFKDEAAQLNLAFVQVVLVPLVEQKFHIEILYLSARPRSAAVILISFGARAWIVRPEKCSAGVGSLLARLARFWRDDEEMERFFVLTSNISRFLFVIPASIVIRMHTRLARVKPNGKATHRNLPAPILMYVL
jgi:hypothetical protein